MAEIVIEIVGRIAAEILGALIVGAIQSSSKKNVSNKSKVSTKSQEQILSLPSNKHNRSVLISCSNITFGNECERLVNIAFQTSQTFTKVMSRYIDVIQYLRSELSKQYPNEYFHIIISPKTNFGFSVEDGQYFAEIVQDRYCVLIYSTKSNSQVKLDTQDVNSQMLFKWN